MNTKVLFNLSYGVYAISTLDGDRPTGCIANSVMQVTSSPEVLAISINHDNFTNECIKKCGKLAISILAENSDRNIIGTFGFKCGKDLNKFDNMDAEIHEGISVLKDSCGYIVCKVVNSIETATHTVFLAEMIDGDVFGNKTPMTYAYYHKVVKGKSPKNAPTYQEDQNFETKNAKKSVWRCSVCGYVYDGDVPFEELPDTWTCPLCGQPKSVFVKE